MVNKCKEMEQEYTGNNCTRHLGQPYLLSNTYELNIIVNPMKTDLASATQPTSSIVIADRKVLMQCVIPLLIYPF